MEKDIKEPIDIIANEPAFPIIEDNNYEGQIVREARYNGLTKLEWFAGMALQGMISKHGFNSNYTEGNANEAFRIADAMIKEAGKYRP